MAEEINVDIRDQITNKNYLNEEAIQAFVNDRFTVVDPSSYLFSRNVAKIIRFVNAGDTLSLTGSLDVSNPITGSLFGTASYALSALTASYALNAGAQTTSSYALSALTSSYALVAETSNVATTSISSSYSATALSSSYSATALSATSATTATSASYAITASYADDFKVNLTASMNLIRPIADSTSAITVTKNDGITNIIKIDSTNRQVGINMVDGKTPQHLLELNAGHMMLNYIEPPATAPTLATASVAGNVNTGQHWYYIAYLTKYGQTGYSNSAGTSNQSQATIVTNTSVGGQVSMSNIPTSSDSNVIARKIYRTSIAGGQYFGYYLATINDNTTTVYIDNTADSGLTATDYWYARPNTTSGKIYYRYTGASSSLFNVNDKDCSVGMRALQIATGTGNTAFGADAGAGVTTGAGNVYIGQGAGQVSAGGSYNIGIGLAAVQNNSSPAGSYTSNIGIGVYALRNVRNHYNIAIGSEAGVNVTTGTNNVALGYESGRSGTTFTNTIFLGNYAGYYETASNTIIIDSLDRSNVLAQRSSSLIYGITNATMANQILALGGGGRVGINTTSPNSVLTVNGNTSITGSLTVSNAITASLNGTASWASNFTTTGLTSTVSFVDGNFYNHTVEINNGLITNWSMVQ